jgi:chorismate mutase/prephenate dehydratase
MTTRIGYLGPDNCTFGYQAFTKAFSPESDICRERPRPISFPDHRSICQAVGDLSIDYGVVAVENSVDGVVAESVRAIDEMHAHLGIAICGEVTVPIELIYMSQTGEEKLPKRLLSHQVAIGQCRTFVSGLQKQGVTVELKPSTGAAAKEASQDSESAALASRLALEKYHLKAINNGSLLDHKSSTTRFWILGKQHARKSDKIRRYKTCFLASLEQKADGVLHKTLGVFADQKVSVLLQYPIPVLGKKWEYTFLIEVGGHVSDPKIEASWKNFRELGISLQPLQFLGTYPDVTTEY